MTPARQWRGRTIPRARARIEGWKGALVGGGKHQLIFGSNERALNLAQLGQILFHNPAGIPGMYPAMMLASGEVVPRWSLGIQTTRGKVMLNWGVVRGMKVILDSDLAEVYGIPTFRLNEAVKRNRERFPQDFLLQLTVEEHERLRSQIAMSKKGRGWPAYTTVRVYRARRAYGG